MRSRPDHSLPVSQTWLFKGIECIKVNFSDSKLKRVHLSLNKTCTTLSFKGVNGERTCWDALKGSTKLHLSEIVDIVYGGHTSAFGKFTDSMIRVHAKRRPTKENVI